MGPLVHAGATAALLAGMNLTGYNVNYEIAGATILGGFFLDGDKVFEIFSNRQKAKRGESPDITARCRLLHSIFAWPFGWVLNLMVDSLLPFFAVVLHIFADSFIPGLIKDGKHYPSHPPLKWMMFPFLKKLWYKIVPIGWPVTYPPEFNRNTYWAPVVGGILFIVSSAYWFCLAMLYIF